MTPSTGSKPQGTWYKPNQHLTVKFVGKNMERAATMMKLHGLYKPEQRLGNAKHRDSMVTPSFTGQFIQNIGAYLIEDNSRWIMIRAVAIAISFTKRLGEVEVGGRHDL